MEKTSELVLLNRLAKDEESSRNEQLAQAAQQAALAAQNPSSASASASDCPSGLKRERDDDDSAGPSDSKKHCPDDEEINAQVQSAIDSILNLQRKPPP